MVERVEYYWSEILKELNKTQREFAALDLLLLEFVTEVTEPVNLNFSTFFTSLSYIFHHHNISKKTQIHLFRFRKRDISESKFEEDFNNGIAGLSLLISEYSKVTLPLELKAFVLSLPKWKPAKALKYYSLLRILAYNKLEDQNLIIGLSEELPGENIKIKYSEQRNEIFSSSFDLLGSTIKWPCVINLLDVEVNEQGYYIPRQIIIQPDFLVDVTAVADTTAEPHNSFYTLLTKKLMPTEASIKLLEGHAANYFLDKLIEDKRTDFNTLFKAIFKMYPLVIGRYTNSQVTELRDHCKLHYTTLKWVVDEEFQKLGIEKEGIFIEPSFYSAKYGLQGRLDLFYKGSKNKTAIIELKSGKPFKANRYGLSSSHYIQTLLYDLLVEAAYKGTINPSCFILYSKMGEQGLKYAAPVKALQYEALNERNKILGFESILRNRDLLKDKLENEFNSNTDIKGFLRDSWAYLKSVYAQLDGVEKAYFISFISFIACEHERAKTGVQGSNYQLGQASLWLNPLAHKEEAFEIFKDLEIEEINVRDEEPLIILRKTKSTNELANFRVGDIVVLYPFIDDLTPIETQIYKSTIIRLSPDRIIIRLRSSQFNDSVFRQHKKWNLEHDLLDSSFLGLYRSLFAFTASTSEVRKRILGRKEPVSLSLDLNPPEYLTKRQQEIYQKAIEANDYYLVWGPPGSGKTSQILKSISEYYYNLKKPILLISYTNRAADEICEAIESIDPAIKDYYFRIGSRYSTHPDYSYQLLENKITDISKRSDLLDFFNKQLIVVSTFASLTGKPEIFDLIPFEVAIADEASQVLEPMVAGLMSRMKKTILIGDHKQLPSIVTQSASQCNIADNVLTEIGITDMSMSLFERLYHQCVLNKWDNAFGVLNQQGRMHDEVMEFPNKLFYDNVLASIYDISKVIDFAELITKQLNKPIHPGFSRKVVFLNSILKEEELLLKTNLYEAEELVNITRIVKEIKDVTGLPISLGIITPFRAQIALIRQKLEQENLYTNDISIDTVERYQGSARDIIVISLCANKQHLMSSITSRNKEGVDRKLNVALTRAKHQIIVLGNKEVLISDPNYKAFIEQYEVIP